MANAQLIQMAKDLGKTEGFDYAGEAFAESFGKWVGVAQEQIKERKQVKEQGDALVAGYMENLPNGNELPKIPVNAQGAVNAFLVDQRKIYAAHANALRDLDPQLPEYREHVDAMNKINNAFDNLDKNFESFLTKKEDHLLLVDEGEVSVGNKPEDTILMTNAYTDKSEIAIDEDGNLTFDGVYMKDLPTSNTISREGGAAIFNLKTKALQQGASHGEELFDEDTAKGLVKHTLGKLKRSDIKSLAADSEELFDIDLNIPNDLLHDETRHDELKDLLEDIFLEYMKEGYTTGVSQYNTKFKRKVSEKRKLATPKLPKYSLDKLINKQD